ncbi:unnamed protein product [Rhizopus stolonifer]
MFLTSYYKELPLFSANISVNNARELCDIWRVRINQEINQSKRSDLELLTLPKVVNQDWEQLFSISKEYKDTMFQSQVNSLQLIRAAGKASVRGIETLFESTYSFKRTADGLAKVTPTNVSNAIIQFAWDVLSGTSNAQLDKVYEENLINYAKDSLKFKLFLHSVEILKKKEDMCEEDKQLVKLCLSRVVNLQNSKFRDLYTKILGQDFVSNMLSLKRSKEFISMSIEPETDAILDEINHYQTATDILKYLNTKKNIYMDARDGQPYQTIIIIEYLLNSFPIWKKTKAPSELSSFRKFVTILEYALADTDIIVCDGEHKLKASAKHMQLNDELFRRESSSTGTYSFGRKIDFIMKDSDDNELNTNEFKKFDTSTLVIMTQQIKNLRNNAAIVTESMKMIGDADVIINGIDFIGDFGYTYEMMNYEDVIIALPISTVNTPKDIASLKGFRSTLNIIYYIKAQLIKLSLQIKTARTNQSLQFELADVFDTVEEKKREENEPNTFYSPKIHKAKLTDQQE